MFHVPDMHEDLGHHLSNDFNAVRIQSSHSTWDEVSDMYVQSCTVSGHPRPQIHLWAVHWGWHCSKRCDSVLFGNSDRPETETWHMNINEPKKHWLQMAKQLCGTQGRSVIGKFRLLFVQIRAQIRENGPWWNRKWDFASKVPLPGRSWKPCVEMFNTELREKVQLNMFFPSRCL